MATSNYTAFYTSLTDVIEKVCGRRRRAGRKLAHPERRWPRKDTVGKPEVSTNADPLRCPKASTRPPEQTASQHRQFRL